MMVLWRLVQLGAATLILLLLLVLLPAAGPAVIDNWMGSSVLIVVLVSFVGKIVWISLCCMVAKSVAVGLVKLTGG